jgi:hypothetical protein
MLTAERLKISSGAERIVRVALESGCSALVSARITAAVRDKIDIWAERRALTRSQAIAKLIERGLNGKK